MSDGWIKLHRKISEWDWYNDANTFRLFMHLLLHANHELKHWRGEAINPGQLITGRKSLSEQTGLSPRSVRSSLSNLKSTSEVTIKSNNKYSIITIVKWNEYQENGQQVDQQATSKRPQLKNDKKERKEYTSDFEVFWKAYLRKDCSKSDAGKTYAKVIDDGITSQMILDGLIAFNKFHLQSKTEARYLPHAATWLNGKRWEGEYAVKEKNCRV